MVTPVFQGCHPSVTQRSNPAMSIADALQIILDLAKQNVIALEDHADEHHRQMEAIAIIEDLAAFDQHFDEASGG